MRVLVGKCFGLGNAIMSLPMLKAIRSLPDVETLDVLVGSTPDDVGAFEVFNCVQYSRDEPLLGNRICVVDNIHIDSAINGGSYDVAIMSIPFDGRWRNGVHFNAREVWDGRTRPDPSTTGLVSWKKHEIEYQMGNAKLLGYRGAAVPSCSFYGWSSGSAKDIYLGVGYKKDSEGFWSAKHWGNGNFASLVRQILDEYPDAHVWSTGNALDWKCCLQPIQKLVHNARFIPDITGFRTAFDRIKTCGLYVGNDTGMMHVAASMDIPCVVPFFLENSITKSKPRGRHHHVIDGTKQPVYPDYVFDIAKRAIDVRS